MERTLIQLFLGHHGLKATVLACLLATSATGLAQPQPLDKIVAIVDSSIILQSELSSAMAVARQQLVSRNQAIPTDEVLQREVLRQLILKRAQLERVKRLGVSLDDNTLNAAVAEIARQEGARDLADFQSTLDAKAPGSYAALRQQVNEDLSINRLRQQQVQARIKVSDQDIDNFLKSPQGALVANSEVRIAHLRVALPANPTAPQTQAARLIASQVQTDLTQGSDIDAVIRKNQQTTYPVKGSDMGWRSTEDLPEALVNQIGKLSIGQTLPPTAAADGFHVIKLLDRRAQTTQSLLKQYKVRHILIRPSEVVSLNDAEQQINQLYQRLLSGADRFSNLASTFSNDPGSAANGGDLGWVATGMMVPQFDEIMLNTPVGQVSKPFETQYGWHILTVEDTRNQDVTEQARRAKARQILSERQFDQELDNWLREVRADSFVEIKDAAVKDGAVGS